MTTKGNYDHHLRMELDTDRGRFHYYMIRGTLAAACAWPVVWATSRLESGPSGVEHGGLACAGVLVIIGGLIAAFAGPSPQARHHLVVRRLRWLLAGMALGLPVALWSVGVALMSTTLVGVVLWVFWVATSIGAVPALVTTMRHTREFRLQSSNSEAVGATQAMAPVASTGACVKVKVDAH